MSKNENNLEKEGGFLAKASYSLFDVGNSAVGAMHATFIFAVYFASVVAPENGTSYWGYTTGLAAIVVAVLGPILGGFADTRARRKLYLSIVVFIGVVANILLWRVEPNNSFIWFALIFSFLSILANELLFVFYNALLPSVASKKNMGRISGIGWAVGYFGAIVALVIALAFFIMTEKAPLGLYSYPVLMAADILLYKSGYVPVGEDQKQHLELSRDIAQSFNRFHNVDFFPIPEPLIMGLATRVMSLKDGTNKMSKSDPSDYSRINMTDNTDDIRKKIQKAKTDSLPFPDDSENLESRPEINNLLNIFCSMSETSIDKLIREYSGKDFKKFKEDLFEVINNEISKVSAEMQKLLSDKGYIENLLKVGAEEAREIAENNIREIKKIINFYNL